MGTTTAGLVCERYPPTQRTLPFIKVGYVMEICLRLYSKPNYPEFIILVEVTVVRLHTLTLFHCYLSRLGNFSWGLHEKRLGLRNFIMNSNSNSNSKSFEDYETLSSLIVGSLASLEGEQMFN